MMGPFICIFCDNFSIKNTLINKFKHNYSLILPETFKELTDILKRYQISYLIVYPFYKNCCYLSRFQKIKDNYAQIPIKFISDQLKINFIKKCSYICFDEVICIEDIEKIAKYIECHIKEEHFIDQILFKEHQDNIRNQRIKKALVLIKNIHLQCLLFVPGRDWNVQGVLKRTPPCIPRVLLRSACSV